MAASAAIATAKGLVIYSGGETYPVNSDHPHFTEIRKAIRHKAWKRAIDLINVSNQVAAIIDGQLDGVTVERSRIIYQGKPFPTKATEKILRMRDEGWDIAPMIRFLKKVRENPSFTAQDELFLFCQANGFSIHEDGDIIAYRGVDSDYRDLHTHTFDNSVGRECKMDRHLVDDNRERTCSTGLHFAAYDYVKTQYGGARKMVVKINPRDVVSIPSDYNDQKGRCCRYLVIAEIGKPNEQGQSAAQTPLHVQEVYSDTDIRRSAVGLPTRDEVRQFLRKSVLNHIGEQNARINGHQWLADEDALLTLVEAQEEFGLSPESVEYKTNGLTLNEMEQLIFWAIGV